MTTFVKIILSIIAFFLYGFIVAVMNEASGHKGGMVQLVITAGFIAGLVAIWKYKPQQDEPGDEIRKLNKD